ncbi:MAG TPA: hypothetical protein VFX31_00250, partial [Ktedonobacterales bacterium]|nr:hypothetical protein [Ktedonobacterales bacterium]
EEVLVESRQTGNGQQQWRGRNRANKLVFFPATRPGAEEAARTEIHPGALTQVVIERTSAWSLQGTRALEYDSTLALTSHEAP